ncbi:type III-A CRISPR-associated protein Cas10/Csm1 [Tumebacillus flagellatus]|uniref:CRISPR system single-strand-specific deoxyribonuclease Cas10/Csm1 (subtype III-A) n=1 Tax=Tumebacillus flagellatus TaxID=1157490 RepID=A0A074LN90_9BACL|nr:type III-A CRISPR-associated protein Cas10/Csm1 [Tumebacillus flagellatus]KEO82569.1 hypothetical protein EL26_14380 [Tumebacillus flagellatus]
MDNLFPVLCSMYFPVYEVLTTYAPPHELSTHQTILDAFRPLPTVPSLGEIMYQLSENPTGTTPKLIAESIALSGWTKPHGSRQALATVFSKIELDHNGSTPSYYQLQKLKVDSLLLRQAEPTHSLPALQSHVRQFMRESETLFEQKDLPLRSFLIQMAELIRTWFWCLPVEGQSNTGESVADVCRLASAIASCLCKHPDATQFGLVVGDLSGIQNYIFSIAVSNQKGVAKRLRARSLFLTLLTEVVGHQIVHQFEMDVWNIVMDSGGKLYLLLPWFDSAPHLLEDIQRTLDRWALQQYNGEIVLNLGWCAVDKERVSEGDHLFARLNDSILTRKAQPLLSALTEGSQWDESVWLIPESLSKRCSSCAKFPVRVQNLCAICARDEQVGTKLLHTKYISFHFAKQGDISFFDNYSVRLHSEIPVQSDDTYLVWLIEEDASHVDPVELPLCSHPIANHVPRQDGSIMDFDCIATQGVGGNQLGYLKADVDQLGTIFSFGLKKDGHHVPLTAIFNLSTMLDLFFSAWLPARLKGTHPLTYTVFSGGDDLYLIGPWEEIIRLALDLRDHFRKYTSYHPEITLSASLTFGPARTPIHFQTSIAERDLEKAKETPALERTQSRDQVTLLGVPMSWETLQRVFQEAQTVRQWREEKRIPSALLYRLAHASNEYRAYREGDPSKVTFVPQLVYTIKRNVPAQDHEVRQWLARFVDHQYLSLDTVNPILYMGQIMRLILMYNEVSEEVHDHDSTTTPR